jgi:hypothetical protein
MNSKLIDSFVEVDIKTADNFLKIKETLTRMGICSERDKTLWQSCHILHKQKRYFIVHFKELFALDGKPSSLSEEDRARRNTIAMLLEQWGLIDIIRPKLIDGDTLPPGKIKIISFIDKENWTLVPKYTVGQRRR